MRAVLLPDASVGRHEHIARLDISVYLALGVKIGQSLDRYMHGSPEEKNVSIYAASSV